MNPATILSVEARSLATLKLKVAARKALGWIEDGDLLTVVDFTKRRPAKRYAQVMFRSSAFSFRWTPVS